MKRQKQHFSRLVWTYRYRSNCFFVPKAYFFVWFAGHTCKTLKKKLKKKKQSGRSGPETEIMRKDEKTYFSERWWRGVDRKLKKMKKLKKLNKPLFSERWRRCDTIYVNKNDKNGRFLEAWDRRLKKKLKNIRNT